jgi:hypothetical protein
MDREKIRAFALRDRSAVAAAKEDWWAGRGRAAALHASRALWAHARLVRPDWPTARDRADDLAHHVALKERLDRAARVFTRR